MKYLALIFSLIFSFTASKAQEKEKKVDYIFQYELQYEFSGIVQQQFDSLYQYYIVFRDAEVNKLDKLYIKVGSTLGSSDILVLAVDNKTLKKDKYDKTDEKEKLLSKSGTDIKIDLGIHPYGEYYVEVNSKDKDGEYHLSKQKN